MNRRTLLGTIGGALSLAGCVGRPDTAGAGNGTGTDDGSGGTPDLPESCPTTQGLDVTWPEDLDAEAVESFVEAYERVYYREVVVEYEPESRLDSYELGGSVMGEPRAVGDGWEVAYSGGGGIYRPTLLLGAEVADPPEGADVVPASEVDDAALRDVLETAAETGESEHHVDTPGEEVDRYVDVLASLSADFERLSDRGDGDTLYVDVDGTPVELTARASNFHGDYGWEVRYYVDERVVRRTSDRDADPRDADVLECRPGD